MLTLDLLLDGSGAPAADADAGERAVFATAVRACQPGVTSLVWRLLGWSAQDGEVDDVVQEVFLSAWVHRRRLRDAAAFGGWVRTIAIRQVRNHVRAKTRRMRLTALCGFGPGDEPARAEPVEPDTRVRDGIARLPHADREVIVLRYLEGLAIDAIAELLGVRRSAVDGRLSRARRRLEAFLQAEDS